MKSNIITIAKKELARFFSNRASACIAILLPGVLIFAMWSFMGSALSDSMKPEEGQVSKVAVVDLPISIDSLKPVYGFETVSLDAMPEISSIREAIKRGEYKVVAIFPAAFDGEVAKRGLTNEGDVPLVEVYYDSTDTSSAAAFSLVRSMLDNYEASLANRFDVNKQASTYDVSEEKNRVGSFMVSIVPMILLIMLFTSCMSIAAEAIAGEKERGTMATLLATPTKRSDIALGKILALTLIGLTIAASSTIGILASLPNLTQGTIDFNVYGMLEYTLLGLIIISTTLLTVMLIAIVSALAKTTKEAQLYLTPLMVLVIAIGLMGMFGDGAKSEVWFYLIPIYNSIQCMIGIFSFDFQPINIVVCVVANLVFTGVGVVVLQRMFNSERLMFAR